MVLIASAPGIFRPSGAGTKATLKKRSQIDAIPFNLIGRIFNQHQRGEFVRAQHGFLQMTMRW